MEFDNTAGPLPAVELRHLVQGNGSFHPWSVPWIFQLSRFARSGVPQTCLVALSLLWFICVALYSGRMPLPHRPSRPFDNPSLPLRYEILSQATRGVTTACFAVCAFRHAVDWSIAAATAYAFVLGLVRLISRGRWRHTLLHQVNTITSVTFLSLLIGYWLPCVETSTQCNTRDLRAAGSWALGLSTLVSFLTPREWAAPSLPDHTLPAKVHDALCAQDPAPEETCSWFSYYFSYQWFTPTISRGARNELAKEDLPELPWYDNPHLLLTEVRKARAWGRTTFWTTIRLVSVQLITMAICVSIAHSMELLSPLGMYQLLAYIDSPLDAVFRPWLWLAVLFMGPTAHAVAWQHYVFNSTRLQVHVKSALTQELYHEALGSMELEHEESVDRAGKEQTTTAAGRLATLMAADVEAISKSQEVMKVAIGCPVTVILALVGLYQIIGWPSLVGTAVLMLSSVSSIYTAQLMVPVQVKVREAQDARLSLITEHLSLIQAVKYFAWERFAIRKVQAAREVEQGHLWTSTLLHALVGMISLTLPYLALLAMFGLHVFVREKPLTSSVAFTTVSLVKTIRTKFLDVANLSRSLTTAAVSFRRLDKHFERSRPLQRYPAGAPRICDGTFGRSEAAKFKLRNINIDFVEGGLNVVTGQSGSGKTTLLLSLLGETVKESGSVTRPREIAYASQTAWLQNGTIKDNILFPEVYEPIRYQRIIDACCLGLDLSQLAEGDETTIGENGTSLSGGQRARVALARALYSKAPMILLDDIFSALDAKTAAAVWKECFCSDLLRGRTVLLVTQVPWISSQADLELQLEDGTVPGTGIKKNLGVVRKPVSIDAALATGEGLRDPNPDGSGSAVMTPDRAETRSLDLVDAEMDARKAARMIGESFLATLEFTPLHAPYKSP